MYSTEQKRRGELFQTIRSFHLPHVRVWLLEATKGFDSTHFPVNKLRNLAIENVKTSHYIVLEPSVLLPRNAYQQLLKLPLYLTQKEDAAFLFPVFRFTTKNVSCTDSCVRL